jgi:hypothetical protein
MGSILSRNEPSEKPGTIHVHHPLGIGERERPEEDRVHYAEDRAVRADPERQRHDDDRRKLGRFEQRPEGINQILAECVHAIHPLSRFDERVNSSEGGADGGSALPSRVVAIKHHDDLIEMAGEQVRLRS